ncbi:MAG TPA: MBL fold metallo-hydrolase [Blastocatellia bacterium]|nr:MBL fold metallo-hydrolase [Blastocatellia bacterium]
MNQLKNRLRPSLAIALLVAIAGGASGQSSMPDNPRTLVREGEDQQKALKINDVIYQGIGWGNTFMVVTPDGNVIIDTSIALRARQHHKLLKAESAGPVKYIILTHGHGDHTGGVPVWKEAGTRIIAQHNHAEFMHYQTRLAGFFAMRNAAQFSLPRPAVGEWAGNYGAKIAPDILFDDKYEFELGGIKFEVYHTPGETDDHLTVWLPQYKAAFIGDNYYESFPNIYTLRGTKPRWALDYINSLNKVLALKPEIVLPSHGRAIRGNAEITRLLTRYRDAIQHVHDETVKGLNAGKDVYTLMREIKLPPALDVGEAYGKLSWSVRGIYEGYVGYFDLNPATMYETPASSVYSDLLRLAGGPEAVIKVARERIKDGQGVEALHLTNVVLATDPKNREALEAHLQSLEFLRDRCRNINERGWLDYHINETKSKLGKKP